MKFPLPHKIWAPALVVLTLAAPSYAAPITTLFSTGVDATGTSRANAASELHYTLLSAPTGTATNLRVATAVNGYPIPPWLGDTATSAWIGPNSGTSLTGPAGSYTYRTTFSLAGFIASTASIDGLWAVDNTGVNIRLNGVVKNITITNSSGFNAFSAFSITSGFVNGLNTLDFVLRNTDGPTGLRTQLLGNATSIAIPEPVSLAILGGTLLGFGLIRRKRA